IILDIMLSGMDGFEVCRLIRRDQRTTKIPIIMLTAKGEEIDRIVGFEVGADDYVVKPFSPRELILRVKAIINRRQIPKPDEEVFKFGSLTIDTARHKVLIDKKEINLTLIEFKLLKALVHSRGFVCSREKLLDEVWDISVDITTRVIDTHIKRLREKFRKYKNTIETIRGIGYRFNCKE
ncbi:MAG: response regulator, partial [Elusimicrobia bacterium]|nr:response regulator [Elusimicrobiota bacterium]MBD3412782.1 response regulator [Elusimicrobiota bacterium]